MVRKRKSQANDLVDSKNKAGPKPSYLAISEVSLMQRLLGAKKPISSHG